MQLVIRITKHAGCGYRAWCPALPGCQVHGQTAEEAHRRICDAVVGYMASMEVALPRELGKMLQAQTAEAVA